MQIYIEPERTNYGISSLFTMSCLSQNRSCWRNVEACPGCRGSYPTYFKGTETALKALQAKGFKIKEVTIQVRPKQSCSACTQIKREIRVIARGRGERNVAYPPCKCDNIVDVEFLIVFKRSYPVEMFKGLPRKIRRVRYSLTAGYRSVRDNATHLIYTTRYSNAPDVLKQIKPNVYEREYGTREKVLVARKLQEIFMEMNKDLLCWTKMVESCGYTAVWQLAGYFEESFNDRVI